MCLIPMRSFSQFNVHCSQLETESDWINKFCVLFYERTPRRIWIESCLFLFLPAFLASFFYISVCRVLMARDRDEERNRNLSIAFITSCFFWIVLWLPHYVYFLVPTPLRKYTDRTLGYLAYKYLLIYKSTVQMLYSQINALLVLVFLKPFREQLKVCFLSVLMKFNGQHAGKKQKQPGVKKQTDHFATKHKKSIFRWITFLLVLVAILLASLQIAYQLSSGLRTSKDGLGITTRPVDLKTITASKRTIGNNMKDLIAEMSKPHIECSSNHGFVNFRFQRCYFLARHSEMGLTFVEQLRYCENRGASLFYPRSLSEADYIWNFYTASRNWVIKVVPPNNETWYLHVGLVGSAEDDALRSIDGKFELRDKLLKARISKFGEHWSFTAHRLCRWYKYHWNNPNCFPGYRRDYSVCFLDLFYDPALNH